MSDPGVTLVTGTNKRNGGSNGAGKSTAVVDSITYGLFGQTSKKLKMEQVVNNQMKKNCYVEVGFSIGGDQFVVKRYREHDDFGNSLLFFKNGNELESEKLRDAQRQIDDVIKIGFKSFVKSIVLSTEKVSNFAESDETERRKIIENLLMYDFISKYHKSNKEILRKIRRELEIMESRYNDKKENINTLTNNLIDYIERLEDNEEKKEKRIKEISEKLKTYEELNINIEVKNRNKLNKEIDNKSSLISKLEATEEKIEEETSLQKRREIAIKKKKSEIYEVESNPEECPVCGSKVKEGVLGNYIENLHNEKKSIENDIKVTEEKIRLLENRRSNLKDEISNTTQKIKKIRSKIHEELADEEIENIQSEISELKSELSLISVEVDIENDEYVKKMQYQVDEAKRDSAKLKKKVRKLERDRKHHEFWHNALSNSDSSMKSFCINYILQSLNKYINYYLKFFSLDIEYTLEKDLSDTIIKDGIEHSFAQLSAGEKSAVEVSLIFALYEIVRLKMPDNINVIVLDELLSKYFDDVRVESAIEILEELQSRNLCIFVIDHKSTLQQSLECSIMNVVKDKRGFSTIEPTT
jgi:DNA repair exonuclease SbcCD ATPase subunit